MQRHEKQKTDARCWMRWENQKLKSKKQNDRAKFKNYVATESTKDAEMEVQKS